MRQILLRPEERRKTGKRGRGGGVLRWEEGGRK